MIPPRLTGLRVHGLGGRAGLWVEDPPTRHSETIGAGGLEQMRGASKSRKVEVRLASFEVFILYFDTLQWIVRVYREWCGKVLSMYNVREDRPGHSSITQVR